MRVGAKKPGRLSPILENRTKRSLEYALYKLKTSEISPYIQQVYLYGSCARREQSYGSDVDLFIELDESFDLEKYRSALHQIKGSISPTFANLPDIDLHVTVGEGWKEDKLLYYKNIRKEGIKLWDEQTTHI